MLRSALFSCAIILLFSIYKSNAVEKNELKKDDLLVLTVATSDSDGHKRFLRSAKVYGLNVKVLGMNSKLEAGNTGGQKVNLLMKELDKYKDDKNKVIMFVDSYDVVFIGGSDKILAKFYKTNAKVLFSADGFCWPDENLAENYPEVEKGKRYLNSGSFIGNAPELYKIVSSSKGKNLEDDQLFYTKIYLDEKLRKDWSIQLDHKGEIFQNLNGAVGDVELVFAEHDAFLQNNAYSTNPLVVHGNGQSKVALNSLGNYLAQSWNPNDGCLRCTENTLDLTKVKPKDKPIVLMGLFIEQPTPFLEDFFKRISELDYPKERISILIHNMVQHHADEVSSFVDNSKSKYHSVKLIKHTEKMKEWHGRNLAIEKCQSIKCDYFFSVDSLAMFTNPQTLVKLMEQNRKVIAPMLVRYQKVWSNFWGALTPDGFYARSHDYMDLVQRKRQGVWNVPYVSTSYLINGTLINGKKEDVPSYINNLMDPDMAFCQNIRDSGHFMYVSNLYDYGHLINADSYTTEHLHNDLYQIFDNRIDWEDRYIHEDWKKALLPDTKLETPCPDVFWFPVVTPRYAKELVEEMENFGKWSDGSNQDTRLSGGYENVPTRDIHMNQVGMENQWLHFLREFIRPVQEKVFPGYFQDPPQSLMNFVVRYRADEQASLRPHHDTSTYTINVALNSPGIDYDGGGCRFIRYNCSVTESKIGWTLMHPGRLTHLHEGLKTVRGTRYIMISFVDP